MQPTVGAVLSFGVQEMVTHREETGKKQDTHDFRGKKETPKRRHRLTCAKNKKLKGR